MYKGTFVTQIDASHVEGLHTYFDMMGSTATTALWIWWWTGVTDWYRSLNLSISLDTWYRVEYHLIMGDSKDTTFFEAKIDGTTILWGSGYSGEENLSIISPSADEWNNSMSTHGWGRFWVDGYCNYSGNSGDLFFDDIKITDGGGWIGGAEVPRTLFRP